MKTELRYSWPSAEGVNPEYIVNFLNACEKADSEIHGIIIARHGNVIFEAYNAGFSMMVRCFMVLLSSKTFSFWAHYVIISGWNVPHRSADP